MEILFIVLLSAVLVQTSYLVYKTQAVTGHSRGDILVDTSVLIDARILAIARSGLMSSRLIIPKSVVRELQFMADKADHDKRERARYGLEVIEKLQQLPSIVVTIRDDGDVSEHGVDEQLIILAQKTGAKLCTIDYNLNKAARVQSVEVVNINELAHALRVIHLPGEKIDVQLVQPGQDKKQAVGYLDDGTMVVVDDSRELMGQTVRVVLTRVLQTTAGRMMFARREGIKNAPKSEPKQSSKPNKPNKPTETSTKVDQVPAVQPEKPARSSNARRSSPRKPRSHEDALVDLANK